MWIKNWMCGLDKKSIPLGLAMLGLLVFDTAFAANSFGNIASTVRSSFEQIGNLISAASYLAGLAFSIGAIMKFKQHKDNPTQVPIGTPIALIFIAAALLFLPSILGATAETLFGNTGTVGGVSGVLYGVS